MRLLGFELKKIFMNRILVLGLLVLTLVSSCLYFLEAKPDEDPLLPYLEAYEEYYNNDPEGARAEADAYIKAYKEAEEEAGNYIAHYPDSVHVDGGVGSDYYLYERFYGALNYSQTHKYRLDRIINAAYLRIEEYKTAGYDYNSYAYLVQRQAIIYYSKLYGLEFPVAFNTDIEKPITFGGEIPFLLCVLLLMGSSLLAGERSNGAIALIKTTKRGKLPTALAKIGAVPFGVGAAVLCARLPVIILTYIMLGGEVFTLPVQLAEDFLSCPYPITVLGAELVRMGVYFLCGLVLVYAMLAASALFRGYAPPFICGAAIVLASYLASSLHYYNPGTIPQYLNFITLMGCKKLFTSLVGVKMPIFSSLPCELAAMALYIPITLLCAAGAVLAYIYMPSLPAEKKRRLLSPVRLWDRVRSLLAARVKKRTVSVVAWEFKKLYANPAFVVCLLGILLAKGLYSYEYRYIFPHEDDEVWQMFMEEYEGDYTEEKYEDILALNRRLREITGKKDEMDRAIDSGAITHREYSDYIQEYYLAERKLDCYMRLRDYASRLKMLHEQGVNVSFVYDTGWKNLFMYCNDAFLLAICAIVPIFAFQTDRQNGFYPLLRTQKHGRARTYLGKCLATLPAVTVAALICSGMELWRVMFNFDMLHGQSAAASLEFYAITEASIISEAIKLLVIRVAFANLTALTVLAISSMLHSVSLTGVISAACILVPEVLRGLGYSLDLPFSFNGAITPLTYMGAEAYMPSLIFVSLCTVITLALGIYLFCHSAKAVKGVKNEITA